MTLEDYFYSFEKNLDVFPGKHDYVSAYKEFKSFMDNEVHKETKAMAIVLDDGDIYLNDHSADHIHMVTCFPQWGDPNRGLGLQADGIE